MLNSQAETLNVDDVKLVTLACVLMQMCSYMNNANKTN